MADIQVIEQNMRVSRGAARSNSHATPAAYAAYAGAAGIA